jgi:hypothetical protein
MANEKETWESDGGSVEVPLLDAPDDAIDLINWGREAANFADEAIQNAQPAEGAVKSDDEDDEDELKLTGPNVVSLEDDATSEEVAAAQRIADEAYRQANPNGPFVRDVNPKLGGAG